MYKAHYCLLLADDDIDDCFFFEDALHELPISVALSTVSNGVQLMQYLSTIPGNLPDILFLDLNMPLKSGIECLSEIKLNAQLKELPIIILSTSLNKDVLDLLYNGGAHYYIRKPGEYAKLKKIILEALTRITKNSLTQPTRDKFILQV